MAAGIIGCVVFVTAQSAHAVSVTYTFEQFNLGTLTPIVAASPDSGPASFQATFTSAPTVQDFQIGPVMLNGLFSGKNLAEGTSAVSDTLAVSLNMPITSVSLVFATNSVGGSNSLFFFSSSGNTSMASTAQSGGAGFDGGFLTFSSAIPFTSFSLNTGGGPRFGIDNLVMNTANGVATPDAGSTIMLMLGAVTVLAALRQKLAPRQVNCARN